MADCWTIPLPGTHGNIVGAGSDGVLVGALTATALSYGALKTHAQAMLCITDDGGLYTSETTAINEATADDVEVLPATPANDDAVYFGHATLQFARVDLNTSTAGDGTWTITYEYWDGSAWAALANVTDGTSGFEAAAGWHSITYDLPEDWAKCTVDGVNAYWIRGVLSGYSAVTTAPQLAQGYVIVASADATWTNDTTDINDADAGDVALLPSYPVIGDGFYYGYSAKFCKVKLTHSQARTGTATMTWKYWDGSAWTALVTFEDDTAGYSASAGTEYLHFVPPTDWTANTAGNGPNGQTGYFVVCEMTAITSVTQQPLGTRAWVLPLVTGASGIPAHDDMLISSVSSHCLTKSGTTADSVYLLLNCTSGAHVPYTWTKGTATDTVDVTDLAMLEDEQLAVIQITEDGTTEFASAAMYLKHN